MSHFYGMLKGNGLAAVTRCGTKHSGMSVVAAGWGGGIKVEVWRDERTGEDRFIVSQCNWQGSGIDAVLAEGELGKPVESNGLTSALLRIARRLPEQLGKGNKL